LCPWDCQPPHTFPAQPSAIEPDQGEIFVIASIRTVPTAISVVWGIRVIRSGVPDRWDVSPVVRLIEFYNHGEGKLGIESVLGLSGCLIIISDFFCRLGQTKRVPPYQCCLVLCKCRPDIDLFEACRCSRSSTTGFRAAANDRRGPGLDPRLAVRRRTS
jgi:hypothetical protein